jgi:hypothetical protein
MADFVGSVACPYWSFGLPRCPPSPGSKGRADRPARHQKRGKRHDRGRRQLCRRPDRGPRVRHTEAGSPGRCSGWPSRVGGSRWRRSSPWSCGRTRPSMPRSRWPRAAGWWSWAGSSSAAGPPRTAAPEIDRRGRGRGAGAKPAVGDGHDDQDDEEPGWIAARPIKLQWQWEVPYCPGPAASRHDRAPMRSPAQASPGLADELGPSLPCATTTPSGRPDRAEPGRLPGQQRRRRCARSR